MKIIKTARQWTKAILAVGIASALLTTAWLPWTTLISFYPGHLLYDHETGIQQAMAALLGITAAGGSHISFYTSSLPPWSWR